MHMARLADPSRMPGSYGLGSLSDILEPEIEESKQEIIETYREIGDKSRRDCLKVYQEHCQKTKKVNIK